MASEDPRLESRVARIESDVAHIHSTVANIQLDLRELRRETGTRLDSLDAKLDAKFTEARRETNALGQSLHADMLALDKKVTSQFLWLLSTLIACMLAGLGVLLKGVVIR